VESAVEHAKEGVQQLEKAEQHQKNALPMRCIIALVVLIVIMLIILIAKHAPAQNNNSSN
jgi:syntaxin 16